MNKLYDSMSNLTHTENGALTYSSTANAVLDLFSMGGSLRSRSESDVEDLIRKALKEEPLLAIKCIFYLRDIRHGQGERKLFRIALKLLQKEFPSFLEKVFEYVPEYGRWDDLFDLMDVKEVRYFIYANFYRDIKNYYEDKPISLLSKWMPSINASSSITRGKAKMMAKMLGMSLKDYRQTLSKLRKYLEVVEVKMSDNNWIKIEYDKLPSIAGMKYRKAFKKHDEDRYDEFLRKAEKGEVKINTGTLYPSDIVKKTRTEGRNQSLEVMWKNLPNWITEGEQALVVCDTSGSMSSCYGLNTQPIDVALALTIYYAERNKNENWKDHFITFSARPKLQKIEGNSLFEKIKSLNCSEWDMNTDFNRVFDLILDRAKANNLSEEDMPKKIYVVSDMEFDDCGGKRTNFENVEKRYSEAGYIMPQMVFWNVNSKQNNIPVKYNQKGVALVSGYSPTIFKNLIGNKDFSPMAIMLEVLNGERYNIITI